MAPLYIKHMNSSKIANHPKCQIAMADTQPGLIRFSVDCNV
jgi:hypothetical protein